MMSKSTYAPMTNEVIPRRRRRTWLVLGGVLTLVAVLLASSTVWTSFNRLSADEETQHQTYRQAVSRVELDLGDAQLNITAGQDGQVIVERRLKSSSANSKPTIEESWSGDTLRVTSHCPDRSVSFGSQFCSLGYDLQVPKGVAVVARTTTGATEVRGISGELRLTESTGSVTVSDATGPLTLRTSSGRIHGAGLASVRVDVEAASGDVELSFAQPPQQLTVRAASGNVSVRVPIDEPYQVLVETGTGHSDVDVRNDPAALRTINVHTTSGDVDLGYAS